MKAEGWMLVEKEKTSVMTETSDLLNGASRHRKNWRLIGWELPQEQLSPP